jgi:hypothetical protein
VMAQVRPNGNIIATSPLGPWIQDSGNRISQDVFVNFVVNGQPGVITQQQIQRG